MGNMEAPMEPKNEKWLVGAMRLQHRASRYFPVTDRLLCSQNPLQFFSYIDLQSKATATTKLKIHVF